MLNILLVQREYRRGNGSKGAELGCLSLRLSLVFRVAAMGLCGGRDGGCGEGGGVYWERTRTGTAPFIRTHTEGPSLQKRPPPIARFVRPLLPPWEVVLPDC